MARQGSAGIPGRSARSVRIPAVKVTVRRRPRSWSAKARPRGSPRRAARDDDARRGRDEQRGDLRDERVADAEHREGLGGLGDVHAREEAHHEAADEVDRGDHQARDRVAVDELARAVHRAEEVGLALEVLAALAGGVGVDGARREVGVDRHLLAGHRVEGEARGHLGDAPRALGDHDEVDHREDQEHHEADEHVALDHGLSEGFDDVPRRARTLGAVQEDAPRRRDVEAQAQQRRDEHERGERAEFKGFFDEEGREEHADREGQREGQQHVEDGRRHRHHHHQDDADDSEGDDRVPTSVRVAGDRVCTHVRACFTRRADGRTR